MEKSGKSSSSNSTSSRPELYEHITLLLADPEKQFPEEFDPQKPRKIKPLGKLSLQNFVKCVEREAGGYVVAVQDFDPTGVVYQIPETVELRDGATYIVVPLEDMQDTGRRVSEWAALRFLS